MSRKTTKKRIQALKGLRKWKFTNFLNPLLPIAYKSARIDKISVLKLEGIIKKISYERRDYESVEEKSLTQAMSWKKLWKKNTGTKGLKKMKIYKFLLPFTAYCVQKCTNWQNFDSKIRRDHQKKFLWASRLWVSRGKKLISGYVSKNCEKKNSGTKRLKKMKIYKFLYSFTAYCVQKCTNWQNFDSKIRRDHQKKILWALRLWIGRGKKLISGYVSKNYEKRIQALKGKGKGKFTNFFNPLLPIAYKSARIDKISILKSEVIIKKISYERHDYESVEEKSLSQAMSRKTMKKEFRH